MRNRAFRIIHPMCARECGQDKTAIYQNSIHCYDLHSIIASNIFFRYYYVLTIVILICQKLSSLPEGNKGKKFQLTVCKTRKQ